MTIAAEQPKYVQLAARLRESIRSGELKVGDRLPSYAEMYRDFGATTATVQRVCNLLEQENLIERRSGSGVYVADRRRVQTGNLGLLLHSHYLTSAGNSFIQTVLAGIREGCHETGRNIILVEDEKRFDFTQLDGIVFYGDPLEFYSLNIPIAVPQVMLFQHVGDVNTVTIDDLGGFKLATSYLIKSGHRNIACLMEGTQNLSVQRTAGYRAALQEAGIEADPRWLKQTEKINWLDTPTYLEWARRHMRAWLDQDWAELNCTAIMVQNDHAAVGVMQVLQEVGIDVPGQISVMGFDGTHICDLVRPRLTSIQVPFYQVGREAIKVLSEQINNDLRTVRGILLPVRLRKGDSVISVK